MTQLLLAIDQGTTGTTSLVMDTSGRTLGRANQEFAQIFPEPGLVEHNPDAIWESVQTSVRNALSSASVRGDQITAIGITNQRETTVIWERDSGRPIHNAIVWQDRRTATTCTQLRARGCLNEVRSTTGLVLDPYFSATKVAWILDHTGRRADAASGSLAFGTIDSFLIWKLTGGTSNTKAVHATDATNASRTLLMNLKTLSWDARMLDLFQVPAKILPTIVASAEIVGKTKGFASLPDGIPIAGIAGDQQSALFGQACLQPGDAKCTYGTGAFALVNTGNIPKSSQFGLLTTVAWKLGNQVTYALEGSSFIAGAAVQWLRDGLGIIRSASEIESLANEVTSSEGVIFVPALSGLGAPYWNPHARGLITGITRGTTRAHIARATLEGVAMQVADLLQAMANDFGGSITKMRVDGGAAANPLLMQYQADVSNVTIERPRDLESTARGAAMLAGIGAGVFPNAEAATQMAKAESLFQVQMSASTRQSLRERWNHAVSLANQSQSST